MTNTNETKTIRVTKAQKLSAIKEMLRTDAIHNFPGTEDKEGVVFDYNAAIAFLDAELALLSKKNNSNSKAQTKADEENAALMVLVTDYLLETDEENGVTNSQILRAIPDFSSGQKVTSIVNKLVEEGKVIKNVIKGKNYYALA